MGAGTGGIGFGTFSDIQTDSAPVPGPLGLVLIGPLGIASSSTVRRT